MSGLIYTRKCVICGSPEIYCAGGHVIRRETFISSDRDDYNKQYQDLRIIASLCKIHSKQEKIPEKGYYGEYQTWMGMCDDPFELGRRKWNNEFR